MTPTEYRQRQTDEEFARHEARQADKRFSVPTEEPFPQPAEPKRYRVFTTPEQAMQDPHLGPMMEEEDERERVGLPPRFSLL